MSKYLKIFYNTGKYAKIFENIFQYSKIFVLFVSKNNDLQAMSIFKIRSI